MYRAFAIPLIAEDMADFMDRRFELPPDMQRMEKMAKFYRFLPLYMPPSWIPRFAHVWVPIPGHGKVPLKCWDAPAIVIATNETEEDIKRAEDLELVSEIQRIIGIKTAPGWHIVSP